MTNFDPRSWHELVQEEMDRPEIQVSSHHFPASTLRTSDWLLGEAQLASVSLDKAIRQFSRTGVWPSLTGEQLFYMLHRLMLADAVLDGLSVPEESHVIPKGFRALKTAIPIPPDSNKKEDVLPWLLIDVWNAIGAGQLEEFAKVLLQQYLPAD